MPRKRLPEDVRRRNAMEKRTRYKERNKFVSVRRETLERLERISQREKLTVRDTITMLVQVYEDKVKAEPKYIASQSQELQLNIPQVAQLQPRPQAQGLKVVEPPMNAVRPKRKRGRPPKNRAVELNLAPPRPPRPSVMNLRIMPAPAAPGYVNAMNGSVPEPVVTQSENPSNLSPAVRSARLALSRALQNSCKALVFQGPPPLQPPAQPPAQSQPPRERVLVVEGQSHDILPAVEAMAYPLDNWSNPHRPGTHEEDGSLPTDQTLGVDDTEAGQQPSGIEAHVALDQDILSCMPPSEHCNQDQGGDSQPHEQRENEHITQQIETAVAGSNHDRIHLDFHKEGSGCELPHESGESVECESGIGTVSVDQPSRGSRVEVRRVPDPMRRSRLNQITGGLLNKLKMKGVGEAQSSCAKDASQ